MKNDLTLDTLAAQFIAAKAAEDAAIKHRRDIGKLLEDAMPGPADGSISTKLEGGVKVTVTRKINRKIDSATLSTYWDELSPTAQATFKWSADLDLKHYRALQELNSPDLAVVSTYITSKPAAASVSVELIPA